MKKVLVTGGAGFLGSHLCETLLQRGYEVICLDNFFTGKKSNIAHLFEWSGFEIVRHDIVEPILLEVDQIYNLACPASPHHYQHNPVKTIKTNILGTLHMLGIAKRVGATVLQASTSEVYGDPLVHPQVESYWGNVNPIGPRSCYDEGKRVAETLMFDYHRNSGVDIRVIRIFNTYGPRMAEDDGRVISNFIVQALRGEDLTIYGEGNQTRSFCYVDDLIRGMIQAMDHPTLKGPVNLGNDDERTILELAELILRMTDSRSKIQRLPLPKDDPTRRQPDLGVARSVLGYEPLVAVEEGLERTIAFFRGKLRS